VGIEPTAILSAKGALPRGRRLPATDTQGSAIECDEIVKRFGGFVALDRMSLSVARGEIVGIAGPNGAGKTTLFDVLSGYVRPDSGHVRLGGRDVSTAPAHGRARHGLGRTFQIPLVPPALTVGETIEAARIAYRPRVARSEVRHVRELVSFEVSDTTAAGLLDALDRRKLLLACLLLRHPIVLLLDEPCSGLLKEEIDEVDELIQRLTGSGEIAIVVIEHRLELLFAIAHRVLVLDNGRVIAEGLPETVFDDPAVKAAYFESSAA
jgi:branched-chain amino acid transport system ATP-binding protein